MVKVSQQIIADYDAGARQLPVWRLMCIAAALGIDPGQLLGTGGQTSRKRACPPACGAARSFRRGPTPKIQKQLEAILELPRDKRRFVEEVLANILKGPEDAEKGATRIADQQK